MFKIQTVRESFRDISSDILDSDIEDSIQVTMNGTNRWNMADNVAEEKTMDEQVEEIFAMTIKNVP